MPRRIGMISLGVLAVALSSLLLAKDTPTKSPASVKENVSDVLLGTLLTLLSQLIGAMPSICARSFCRRGLSCACKLHSNVATYTSAWCLSRGLRPLRLEAWLHPAACYIRAGALQLVLEELLMGDVHMHPFELLGWEGVVGTVFMLALLPLAGELPGAQVAA